MSGVRPKPKSIEYFECTEFPCTDLYMKVDGQAIGLARHPGIPVRVNSDPSKQGPCPKHRKKLTNE